MRVSHIFEISSISNEKRSISYEKLSISIGNLGFRSENQVIHFKHFKMLGFSHIEFEILSISSEILCISIKI